MKLWTLLLLVVASQSLAKESITLVLASQLDNGHRFYHELLYEALTKQGYAVEIVVPSEHIPQKRVIRMVENNQLSLTWLLATPERDAKYSVVNVPLTNGLIGQRVMLIPPELQPQLNEVHTLQDLQDTHLVAGLGLLWFDVEVWQENGLNIYVEDGEWRSLYHKLTIDGEVNYFPRGMNEVLSEAKQNPHLAIEERLLLVYDCDFKFYLSPEMAKYRDILETALRKAKSNGMLDKLVKKYWGESWQRIDPEHRVVIKLDLPNHTSQNR
ncbi:hypothetical protein TW81_17705 [Vibrio galatheae]|uniref:Solute-binding protein family 3/N-terminal domain-containing protein n=1 Tax=Vibrio galatheae TaxID=579748 RepID=A0A0F4NEM2_9VIBR|nr:hypothetical protein [Vibrio galatheae]KJY81545.1 hypothetical protein TW81_17705 [Vibrio galatheae]